MIIDMHAHLANYAIYPKFWLNGLKEDLKLSMLEKQGKRISDMLLDNIIRSSLKDYDCSKCIRDMEEADIDKTVVVIADFAYNQTEIELSLDEIYTLHYKVSLEHAGKFYIFGGVDPRRGKEGADLFEKGIKEYNFKGLKLYPPCGFELNDSIVYPFYELCGYYEIPVLTHIGPSLKGMKNVSHYPDSMMEIAKIFSDVDFILGHAALVHFEESHHLPLERDNIYLEVSGFQAQLDDRDAIKNKLKILFDKSPNNIVFGTDWPLFNAKGSHKTWTNYFKELNVLTDNQLDLFYYQNAAALLRM